jgi:hypothetical protein
LEHAFPLLTGRGIADPPLFTTCSHFKAKILATQAICRIFSNHYKDLYLIFYVESGKYFPYKTTSKKEEVKVIYYAEGPVAKTPHRRDCPCITRTRWERRKEDQDFEEAFFAQACTHAPMQQILLVPAPLSRSARHATAGKLESVYNCRPMLLIPHLFAGAGYAF